MNVQRKWMFVETISVVRCTLLALVVAALTASGARAQDVFSADPPPDTGGNSGKTGTQGVVGNPFCPPPVIIINGVATTPRNWSCRGDEESYRRTPRTPPDNARLELPTTSSSPNPCQPGGPGGYNFLDNPIGTRLPPGCVRTTEQGGGVREAKIPYDPYYESLPQNTARTDPTPYGSADPGTDNPEQTQDYRKAPMPVGEISPGDETNDGGTRIDRDAIPVGMDSEGKSLPRDTMPIGENSPHDEAEDQNNRKPPIPEERTSPDVGFSVKIYH